MKRSLENLRRIFVLLCFVGCGASCGIDPFVGEPLPPVDDAFMPRPVNEADAIFDDAVIHEVTIELSEEGIDLINDDREREVRANITLDGEPIEDIGFKLRGGLGTQATIDEKPKLGFDFNEFVPGRRILGLEKLSFNSAFRDCSYLREPLAFRVFELAGVPAPRTGFVHVTLNNQDYGLYVLIEAQDDRFLDARYENPNGNLYDGKYRRDRWPFQRLDFDVDRDTLFELEEGTDVEHEDIIAVSDAVKRAKRGDDYLADMTPFVDWGEAMRFFITEQWVGQGDGYTTFRNNYRVYFDVSDGRVDFMPFDLDVSFGTQGPMGTSGRISADCQRDLKCAATLAGTARQVTDRINVDELLAWYDAIDALTIGAAQSDPKRACPAEQIVEERAALREWIQTRHESLLNEWNQQP